MKIGTIEAEIKLDTESLESGLKEAERLVKEFSAYCEEHGLDKNTVRSLLMFKFRRKDVNHENQINSQDM